MGRQTNFYAQAEDFERLVSYLLSNAKTCISARCLKEEEVVPLGTYDSLNSQDLFVWRRDLGPVHRHWVPEQNHFTIDYLHLPVIELSASFHCEWEGCPALGQGRVYAEFARYLEKPAAFSKWYSQVSRWIAKNWRSSPVAFGGYIAPDALEFYERGGLLLPSFQPPPTPEWKAIFLKQKIVRTSR